MRWVNRRTPRLPTEARNLGEQARIRGVDLSIFAVPASRTETTSNIQEEQR
jgi:hypothetical protein